MVNLRTLAIVTLCLSALVLTCESKADVRKKAEKKKVQVTSLQVQKQEPLLMQSIIPTFSDLSELFDYKDKWLSTAPKDVLTAFNQYGSQQGQNQSDGQANSKENIHENVDYSLALADVYIVLADYSAALNELDAISLAPITELASKPDSAPKTEHVLTPENKIKLLEKKAQILTLQNNLFEAISFLTRAHKLAVTNKLNRQAIFISLLISERYITLADEDKAIYWQQEALSLLEPKNVSEKDAADKGAAEQDNLGLLIEASILLAKQQEQISQHLSATRTLVKVIDLVEDKNYDSVESSLRMQLSHNFMQAQQYINAEQELEKSYKLAVKSRNQQQQVMSVVNLINTYIVQGKFDDANSLLNAAERLARFLTTAQDKRDFKLAKAQVLAGFSKYSQALTILNSIDDSGILDINEKQALEIKRLELKAKWLALTGQKYQSVDAFEQLLQTKLAEQQHRTNLKLDFVLASYRHDIEQIKQQGLDDKTLNAELLKQNQEYAEDFSNVKVWLFLLLVLFIVAAYFVYRRLQPKKAESLFLDPITGAHNHSYFVKHLNLLMKNNMPFSLVMFDIDNMRKINQKLGHELGDRLLTQIVERLEVRLGSNKLLVRLSGDQFIVIAKNFSLNQAFALAEILRKELNSNKFHVDNLSIHLSASFGVICHYENMTIDSMKDDVKKVLDKAKSKGGNITQVVGFC